MFDIVLKRMCQRLGLTTDHHKQLLKDILNTHYGDGAATLSEYEQLYRSTNAMMTTDEQTNLSNTIRAINGYSEIGMKLDGYDDHLNQNRGNLESWIEDLQ